MIAISSFLYPGIMIYNLSAVSPLRGDIAVIKGGVNSEHKVREWCGRREEGRDERTGTCAYKHG